MARAPMVLLLILVYVLQVYSHPMTFLIHKLSPTSPEGNWLWGWVWGAESTVSIVDRSPPLTFHSRPAAFGAELHDPLLGYVIPLSSFTKPCKANTTFDGTSNSGCPPLCVDGTHEPDPTETWIALVQRGGCAFVEKVREAQRLGAKAVVVGGENPDLSGLPDTLVNMYSKGDASDVTIHSTYIKYSDYNDLISLIKSSTTSHAGLQTLSLLITTQYSAWEWYSPIITFIVILILPSCLTFITLLIHRVRMARAAQRDRAPEDIVKKLPWRVWNGTAWEKHEGPVPPLNASSSSSDVDLEPGVAGQSQSHPSTSHDVEPSVIVPWCESQVECAICLSEFVKGDRVRELPCHHIFHLDEVDAWLISRKKLCPVCKADVTQPWHLSQTGKPPSSGEHGQEAGEQLLSRSPTPPPNERTPLLRDHNQNVDS
ncbi:hypothetical protein BJ138DRAFT_1210048 [Hygrophoropsis aurantiaca]|uniref:Uncharacterized protein n=1 Tax=Hygrophoropsis aurantiaca TaxID=72124 RepID=A0ACB8AM51_9AGAM|nr:hypothetical protein BJ138DRAFT_1210048 [Hygrophoropsis aurantiaca]